MTDPTPEPGRRRAADADDTAAVAATGDATAQRRDSAGLRDPAPVSARQHDAPADRRDLLQREKDEFGGMRFFLAFFGWLTATGAVVLLSAIVTGILALIGVKTSTSGLTGSALTTAAIISAIVLAVVLFVGYYIGGYVAARMARFSGLKQGLAVWLWAIIIAILAAAAGAISANALGAFKQLNTAGLPISGSLATTAGVITLAIAVIFSLLGALVGGLGGMRFHRKVDRFTARA